MTPPRVRLRRATYAWLTLAYLAFVWYGSLIPLNFEAIPLDEAIRRFMNAPLTTIAIDARTDFAANVVLFVPFAFLLMASLRTDRAGGLGDGLVGLALVPLCTMLSMCIEFSEMFFPGRTLSFNDVLAQTIGGVIGVAGWLAIGRSLTEWARASFAERQQNAFLARLLSAYCVMFVVAQLAPLDVTINPAEIAEKVRQGRITLIPFSFPYPTLSAMAWDHVWDVLLNVPLGAAAVMLWRPTGRARTTLQSLMLAAIAVAGIECGQIFVMSRQADVTDVIKGVAGAALGVVLAARYSGRSETLVGHVLDRGAVAARLGLAIWMVALVGAQWAPFDFSLERSRVMTGIDQLLAPPLFHYFWAQEYQAFVQLLRAALLALPFGVMLHIAWPDGGRSFVSRLRWFVAIVGGSLLLFAIEAGKILLPGRIPDITDVILGVVGIAVGLWLAGRLRRLWAPSDAPGLPVTDIPR